MPQLDIETIKDTLKNNKAALYSTYGIREIGVFGSYTTGEADEESDIDILIEFEKSGKSFDNYMGAKFFLEDIFHKKIDLIIGSAIKSRLREQILSEVVYV